VSLAGHQAVHAAEWRHCITNNFLPIATTCKNSTNCKFQKPMKPQFQNELFDKKNYLNILIFSMNMTCFLPDKIEFYLKNVLKNHLAS